MKPAGLKALRELNDLLLTLSPEELATLITDIKVENPDQYAALERAILGSVESEQGNLPNKLED